MEKDKEVKKETKTINKKITKKKSIKAKNEVKEDKTNSDIKTAKNEPRISSNGDIKTNASFNLLEVVIIILITGIVVSITSGLIVYTNYDKLNSNSFATTKNSSELNEFVENYNKIVNGYVEQVDKKELIESAIAGMYNYLNDEYSMYLSTSDTDTLETQLEGEYEGIGIEITTYYDTDAYKTVITKIFKDTPAEKAGLKVNDILINLDGTDLKDKDSEYVANYIKNGDKDSFDLVVLRDNKEINIKIKREHVFIDSVHTEVYGNTGYIKLDTFSSLTYSQIKSALDGFDKNVNSLIIDVRDNTGGYLSSVSDISDLFVEKGKAIYQIKDRNNRITTFNAKDGIYRNFNKIAVLINGNSASASEILTLALKESASAIVVGLTSYGKGTVQETNILDSGAMVKYTTSYWLSPNGNSINKIGIKPDIEIENEENQLQEALEAVK